MKPTDQHPFEPDVSFDGGDLDCGNGLLLLIRKHIDPMARGQVLEIRSAEISVDEDLPAWCRMTANELVSFTKVGTQRSFLVCKGKLEERGRAAARPVPPQIAAASPTVAASARALPPVSAPPLPPLAGMGIGRWAPPPR